MTTPRPVAPAATTPANPFPAVIVAAVDAFVPRPPGLQAPITLPPAPAAVSAQSSGLGGTDAVTLIATPRPLPLNDPSLRAGAPGTEDLGTFSTTATSSPAAASTYLTSNTSASVPSCATPATPAPIGVAGATACTTLMGGLITWHTGSWTVAVQELGSATSPTTAARSVASEATPPGLPGADRGILSVVVPANATYGNATTTSLSWQRGADVYQVRTSRGWSPTLSLADSMRPYPAG